jgi:hypothetical protein
VELAVQQEQIFQEHLVLGGVVCREVTSAAAVLALPEEPFTHKEAVAFLALLTTEGVLAKADVLERAIVIAFGAAALGAVVVDARNADTFPLGLVS